MQSAPVPPDEERRLRRLYGYGILDTLDEEEYTDIVRLVSEICRTPMANISFVDRDRQWFKAVVGLESRETPRDVAFCAHTILGTELFTVEDAAADPRFHDNPLVTGDPTIRFYAGMPLTTPDGFQLGALCAIDSVPRTLTATQRDALVVLARHVVDLLELRSRNRELERLSEVKTRMLAIIAHDLRSPVSMLSSMVSLLSDDAMPEEEREELMRDIGAMLSSTRYLIDNVMGWASRELTVDERQAESTPVDIARLLDEIVESARFETSRKGNSVSVELPEPIGPLVVERSTIVFIVRNLLMNANKFTSDGRIALAAWVERDTVHISVSDSGIGMDQQQVESLFHWDSRSRRNGTAGERGAGLALLLSHDLARRIDGRLSVESEPDRGSTFILTFRRTPA